MLLYLSYIYLEYNKMADLLINSQVQSLFAELGAFNGEKYVPSDKCYCK